MTTIKHPLYKEFYEKGIISITAPEDFKKVFNDCHDPFGRELITILYYCGTRPVQLLQDDPKNPEKTFTTDNIVKEGNDLKITIPPAKNGLPTIFYLSLNWFGVKNLYNTCQKLPPKTRLFARYSQSYVRKKINKKGEEKYYIESSDKFRYYFKKWFKAIADNPIPPYFLRHSRFSSMSQSGADMSDIMLAKGARSLDSVRPYLHMSKKRAKNIKRFIR